MKGHGIAMSHFVEKIKKRQLKLICQRNNEPFCHSGLGALSKNDKEVR
jgi:hypothetical protein